jgi:putative FmdB family regulatory protein
MPTYEYICEKCGHEFETSRSISAAPLKICPENLCARKKWGRGKVKKKVSAGTGLLFKGSGFYITDYRSEKYKAAAKKDSPAPKTSGGDAKPAAKSETASAAPAKKADKK